MRELTAKESKQVTGGAASFARLTPSQQMEILKRSLASMMKAAGAALSSIATRQ